MPWFTDIDTDRTAESAEKAFAIPIGMASPFWAAYAGATAAGVGLWWMSQWAKPMNLEAYSASFAPDFRKFVPETPFFAPFAEAMAAFQPEPVALPEDLDEEALEPVRAAMEPVLEAVEMAAEATVEIIDAVVEATPDDLTVLTGIGPTLAAKLGDLGVTTYAQIAAWTEEDIERFDKSLKLMGRVTREKWIDQASQLAAG